MTRVVLGVFHDKEKVEAAINHLTKEGFAAQDISIVMKESAQGQEVAEDTGATVASGAATGATTGVVVGGIAGLLTGIGAIAIPGFGGLLIGGPLAAALGLTGAAATTVSGAATGAVAGGVIGALAGLGLSQEDAQEYEKHIREGAILLAVPAGNASEQVRTIFEEHDATTIKSVSSSDERYEATPQRREREDYGKIPMYAGAKGGRTAKKGIRKRTSGENDDATITIKVKKGKIKRGTGKE